MQKFNSAGVHQGNLGTSGTGLGEFDNPAGVEVSGTTLYVTDFNNDRVQRWSTITGLPLGAFGDSTVFNGPIAVAISADGTVFVADNDNNRVRAFDALGLTPGQIIGSAGSGNGQFDLPRGLATGSLNSLFVTDESNRVQKFVEPVTGSSVRTSGTRLVFDAEAGRNNRVSVSQSGSTFTFTELAASDPDGADTVTPGAGCAQNGANSVTCTNPSITRLSFTVEDLDDTVTVQSSVSASVAATINGGAGADLLTGGPGNDVLAGGDGSDTLAGSGGTDTASYSDSATGVTDQPRRRHGDRRGHADGDRGRDRQSGRGHLRERIGRERAHRRRRSRHGQLQRQRCSDHRKPRRGHGAVTATPSSRSRT